MVQNLEGMSFTAVPFGQGFKDMSPPTKALMKLMLEEKSTEKIDGAIATIMALDRAIRCGNDLSEIVYDIRGLRFYDYRLYVTGIVFIEE